MVWCAKHCSIHFKFSIIWFNYTFDFKTYNSVYNTGLDNTEPTTIVMRCTKELFHHPYTDRVCEIDKHCVFNMALCDLVTRDFLSSQWNKFLYNATTNYTIKSAFQIQLRAGNCFWFFLFLLLIGLVDLLSQLHR